MKKLTNPTTRQKLLHQLPLIAGLLWLANLGTVEAVVVGRRGAVIRGPERTAVVTNRTVAGPLPRGYVRVVPGGYRRVVVRGENLYYAGGVYYRPEIYGGERVYVRVNP